jgi:hypothetical protein
MTLTTKQPERSDLLHDAVIVALGSSGYRLLRNVECKVLEDLVILTGILPSFYLKQVAQTIAMGIDHVREVRNMIEVNENYLAIR